MTKNSLLRQSASLWVLMVSFLKQTHIFLRGTCAERDNSSISLTYSPFQKSCRSRNLSSSLQLAKELRIATMITNPKVRDIFYLYGVKHSIMVIFQDKPMSSKPCHSKVIGESSPLLWLTGFQGREIKAGMDPRFSIDQEKNPLKMTLSKRNR